MTLQGALRFDRNWSFSPEQRIGRVQFPADGDRVPGNARRERLQGHLAARRRRLRPVRQRQDGGEGELRQVSRADEQQQQLHPLEPDQPHRHHDRRAFVDRHQQQLHAGLRPADSRGAEILRPPDRRRLLRRDELDQTFGTTAQTTANIDPRILNGWSVRSNDWQMGASVQQQLLPRVSVEVGYFRRWLNNFTVTDNLAVGAADFTPYSITAPSDPRLPDGGGYVVDGLYNVVQEQVRPDQQQHHAGRELRRAVPALQRLPDQRERAARPAASSSRAASTPARPCRTTATCARRCPS